MDQLTVRGLIQRLENMVAVDPTVDNLPVDVEGCDCSGAARSVSIEEWREHRNSPLRRTVSINRD
jgi:hypothetical protein